MTLWNINIFIDYCTLTHENISMKQITMLNQQKIVA